MAKATQYKKDKQAYAPSKGENFTGKSKTVPNEAFSVREMLIKHANGTMYDNVKTPFYEEQATFSTKPLNVIQSMDLTEKLIYLKEVQEQAKGLENKVKAYQDEQKRIEDERQQQLTQQQQAKSDAGAQSIAE